MSVKPATTTSQLTRSGFQELASVQGQNLKRVGAAAKILLTAALNGAMTAAAVGCKNPAHGCTQ